jgi:hypothetical protein
MFALKTSLGARHAALAAAVLLPLIAGPMMSSSAAAAEPATVAPVVVELFTSQGCSSCPPADALLTELAGRPDVVALSLHVDYWDYIGWKDPYASPQYTARQQRYAEALHLRYVYTPQIVVDGRTNVVGSHRAKVLAAIEAAAQRDRPIDITFGTANGGTVIIPEGHAPEEGATVWLAIYDSEQVTEIKRGENAGHKLRNANVVRSFERLGTWMGARLEIPLDLAGARARGRDGCAVIVQQGRTGPILAAAAMSLVALDQ